MISQHNNSNESEHFLSALGYAFDIVGPVSQKRLYEYLKVKYNIDVRQASQSDLPVIKHAIADIFGEAAAQLIMKQIYEALDIRE